MPVTIQIQKTVNIQKLIKELSVAGFKQTSSRPGEFITVEDSNNISAVTAVYVAHDPIDYEAQATAALIVSSEAALKAIPDWATYTETQGLAWVETNIGTPLADGRATLPANITLTNIRPVLVKFLDILDKMLFLLIVLVRVVIALRDRNGKSY